MACSGRTTAATLEKSASRYGYKEPVFASVPYQLRPRDPNLDPVYFASSNGTADYVYKTPTAGLIVGALVGWLLLAIVIFVRAGRQKKTPWAALFTACIGSVILTLVLRYGAGISLPITVGVNDFYGALIVGLLSHRLATPLLEWLGVSEPNEAPPAPAAEHPAEPPAAAAKEPPETSATMPRAADADAAPGAEAGAKQ